MNVNSSSGHSHKGFLGSGRPSSGRGSAAQYTFLLADPGEQKKESHHQFCMSSKTYLLREIKWISKWISILIESIVIDNRSSPVIGHAHLQSQKGLLLHGGRGRLSGLYRLGNGLDLGGFGEVLGLDRGLSDGLDLHGGGDLGRLGGRRAAANVLLGLVAVLAHVLLHDTSGVGGTLASKVLQLVGLGTDDLLKVGNLLVNDFAVADVHKRSEVGNSHGDNGQTPEGNESDEPIAGESSSESLESHQKRSIISIIHVSRSHTAIVWTTFSANRMRWNSIRKKSNSWERSSRIASWVSLGMV